MKNMWLFHKQQRQPLTNIVTIRATVRIGRPITELGLSIFVVANPQNVIAGPPIRTAVSITDDASGPNINLPPQKNLWEWIPTDKWNEISNCFNSTSSLQYLNTYK